MKTTLLRVFLGIALLICGLLAVPRAQVAVGNLGQTLMIISDVDGDVVDVVTGTIPVAIAGTAQTLPVSIADTISVSVANGSTTVTEDGSIPADNTSVAQTAAMEYRTNGSTRVILFADPCQTEARTAFTISTTANVQLITGTASERIYLCDVVLQSDTAQDINLVSGTGSVCATGTTAIGGISGGTTAATGFNLTAGSGLVKGSGGYWIGRVANLADNVCLFTSSTGQISGGGSYVSQ